MAFLRNELQAVRQQVFTMARTAAIRAACKVGSSMPGSALISSPFFKHSADTESMPAASSASKQGDKRRSSNHT